jgi:hypothetical protein
MSGDFWAGANRRYRKFRKGYFEVWLIVMPVMLILFGVAMIGSLFTPEVPSRWLVCLLAAGALILGGGWLWVAATLRRYRRRLDGQDRGPPQA